MNRIFRWEDRRVKSWNRDGTPKEIECTWLRGELLGFACRDNRPIAMMLAEGDDKVSEVEVNELRSMSI